MCAQVLCVENPIKTGEGRTGHKNSHKCDPYEKLNNNSQQTTNVNHKLLVSDMNVTVVFLYKQELPRQPTTPSYYAYQA